MRRGAIREHAPSFLAKDPQCRLWAGLLAPGSSYWLRLPTVLRKPGFPGTAVALCSVRPRIQRRDRDGLEPSSLFFPRHARRTPKSRGIVQCEGAASSDWTDRSASVDFDGCTFSAAHATVAAGDGPARGSAQVRRRNPVSSSTYRQSTSSGRRFIRPVRVVTSLQTDQVQSPAQTRRSFRSSTDS